ncbi:MAG: hypothetical protein M3448_05775 [Pseudomonadota bacterium]|nr:hypothetical protein [Pseudomonadota bacterium]
MAEADTDLPEGTDKIIDGAMNTDSGQPGNTPLVSTTSATGTGSGTGRSSTARSASTAGSGENSGLMDKVRDQSGKLSEQAAGKAREFVGQGMERSAEAISNVSRLVGDTASGLDERLGEEYGNYARRAAETLEGTATRLASKDPDELIDDTREFIRKSPGVALAGAAIVGFALARLVKSGLSEAGDDDDGNGGSTGGRSKGSKRSRS